MRPQTQKGPSANTRYVGVVYGVVTQNKDSENKNRIKVKLPWLESENEQSHWAQTNTPMEGKEFGFYCLPDVDDAVCLMFMHGDLNHPIMLGGVWSKEDKSPEPNEDGKNNFRGYRSRAGARMILDDTDKTKIVFSDSTTDMMIGIGMFEEAGAGPNKCAVFKPQRAGQIGISISSMKGPMQMHCPKGKLTVEAEKNILIDVKQATEMCAGKDFTLEAKTIKLTAAKPAYFKGKNILIDY